VREIGLDVDRLGEPRADVVLAPGSDRLSDVDRGSIGGGGEKRDGIPRLAAIGALSAAIGALSAHPRVLHHVVGVCRACEDAIGDTEEAQADGLKLRGVRVGDVGVRG
jgi:hypothetical protein